MKVRWKCGSFVSCVCSVGCRVHQTISQNECIYHYHLRARNLFSLFTAIIIHYYHNWGYHSLAWPGTQRCLDLSCHCLYCGPYEGVCDVTCNVEFNPLVRCYAVICTFYFWGSSKPRYHLRLSINSPNTRWNEILWLWPTAAVVVSMSLQRIC